MAVENKQGLTQIQQKAVEAVRQQHTISAAAQALHLPVSALMGWMSSSPEFEQAVTEVFQGLVDADIRRQAVLYASAGRVLRDVRSAGIMQPATRAFAGRALRDELMLLQGIEDLAADDG